MDEGQIPPRDEGPPAEPPRGAGRRPAVPIGHLFGIQIAADLSWLIIFLLVTGSIAQAFRQANPSWPGGFAWMSGLLTSLLYFFSVFMHELGHCLAAQLLGIPVQSITLFIFGGIAKAAREPRKPQEEFIVAAAGPVVSFSLGLAFLAASVVFNVASSAPGAGIVPQALMVILVYVGGINLALFAFNLIPGFPLDGGRMLRAFVWAGTGSHARATRAAAATGKAFAAMMMAAGIGAALAWGSLLAGLWLGVLGLFLWNAARASAAQAFAKEGLGRLLVGDALEREVPRMPGRMSVAQLLAGPIGERGDQVFLVESDGRVTGIVTVNEARAIPEEERTNTPIQAAAVPIDRIESLSPRQTLLEALERMDHLGAGLMPVAEEGTLLGVLTREGMARCIDGRGPDKKS